MNFDTFISIWTGKYCEVAGSPGAQNQCVDIVNAYIRDVLKQPIVEWTNAVDFPERIGNKYEFIPKTPTGIPQKGDIIIWNKNVSGVTGVAGHIAIFVEGTVNSFKSFDQNFPTGSPCKIVSHTYNGVRGWLRLKGGEPMADIYYKGYDLTNQESMKVAVDVLVRLQQGEFVDKVKYEQDTLEKTRMIGELNDKVVILQNENAEFKQKYADTKKQNALLQEEIAKADTDVSLAIEKQLEAEHEVTLLSNTVDRVLIALELPFDAEAKDIEVAIENLQKPHDKVADEAVKQYLYKRAEKLFTSFTSWIKYGIVVWRNKKGGDTK